MQHSSDNAAHANELNESPEISESHIRTKYVPKTDQPAGSFNHISDIEREVFADFAGWDKSVAPAASEKKENIEIPRQRFCTITDTHGNPKAFIHSLEEAGLARINDDLSFQLTKEGLKTPIIISGDSIDRGPQSLRVLDIMMHLKRQGAHINALAGDHEIMALLALDSVSMETKEPHFLKLLNKLTPQVSPSSPTPIENLDKLLKEEARKKEHQDHQLALYDAGAFLQWYVRGGHALLEEIAHKYFGNRSNVKFNDILKKANELFGINGVYGNFLREMPLFGQIDDILLIHAGLDDTWAQILETKGIEGANDYYHDIMNNGNYDFLVNGPLAEAVWKRGHEISPYAAKVLKGLGISTIVRGHDRMRDGIQKHYAVNGINIINNDTGILHTGKGGTIIHPDGSIKCFSAHSAKEQRTLFKLPAYTRPQNRKEIAA